MNVKAEFDYEEEYVKAAHVLSDFTSKKNKRQVEIIK